MGANMSEELVQNQDDFLKPLNDDNTENGLYLSNYCIPEEILTIILSYVGPEHLLKVSLVCRKWCRIIRSYIVWSLIYKRIYSKKPKRLPWYTFYSLFTSGKLENNLIKNGNGQQGFMHWRILRNGGDQFIVETTPVGADPLPLNVPEFNRATSCFTSSYQDCCKQQVIDLTKDKLFLYILKKHKPHIYVSEWVAGRFDCDSKYVLSCILISNTEIVYQKKFEHKIHQVQGSQWVKNELIIDDYPMFNGIVFQHRGQDTQFWKGHYGSKMAGGVLKFLFDTLRTDE